MGINSYDADKAEETPAESQNSKKSTGFGNVKTITVDKIHKAVETLDNEKGKIGWILLWVLGIPIPILLVLFVLRGCT